MDLSILQKSLPTIHQINLENYLNGKVKALIIGRPGSGKTYCVKSLPNPEATLVVSLEGGLRTLSGTKGIQAVDVSSWTDLKAIISHVRMNISGITNLFLDTLDEAAEYLKENIINNRKEDDKKKFGPSLNQQEWGTFGSELSSFIRTLRDLDCNVFVTCHEKPDKDEMTGAILHGNCIQGATHDKLEQYFDFVFFAKSVKTKGKDSKVEYYWKTKGDESYAAKDRDGRLPEVMIQDWSEVFKIINQPKL